MKKLFLSLFILFASVVVNAQADTAVLQQYAGKFKFPEGSPVIEIVFKVENGTLMANSAMGSTEFKQTSTVDVFEIPAYSGTATFKRTEGKITSVLIEAGDVNMEGTKTEGTAISSSPDKRTPDRR
jgi:hypothetical protein